MSRFWTLGHVLRRCDQVSVAIWAATCGPAPTAPQYAVLTVVAAMGGGDMQTVGSVAGLEKTTLTGVAQRLERDGWLQRRQDPRDRRRHVLTLTSAGAVALRQTASMAETAHQEFLAPVALADRERLSRHLRDLGRVARPQPGVSLDQEAWERMTSSAGHLIRRAQQAHTACWLAEFGQELTGPQYAVLRMVSLQGPMTHARLGELAALDKATLSGVVDRLIHRGLLAARPAPHDRRARQLSLTATGHAVELSARPRVRRVQLRTAEPVVEEDRAWVQAVLERLAFRSGEPEIDLDDLAIDAR